MSTVQKESIQKISLGHFDKNKVFIPWIPKVIIPKKVEHIIRTFCNALPSNEWSGVLFYKVNGSFKDKNLEIICEDIFLMDIGTPTFTEFEFTNPDIASYLADHPDLMDCYQGLIHSHDSMTAFFSGQDVNTLAIEAKDTVNFVSLIVNDAGVYVAAITRQKIIDETVSAIGNYTFFGIRIPVKVPSKKQQRIETEYIECEVEKEEDEVENSDYLTRLVSLNDSKSCYRDKKQSYPYMNNYPVGDYNTKKEPVKPVDSFKDWRGSTYHDPDLFGPDYREYDKSEIPQSSIDHETSILDFEKIDVTKSKINELVLKIISGSPFINAKNAKNSVLPWSQVYPRVDDFTDFMDKLVENLLFNYDDVLLNGQYDEDEIASIAAYKAEHVIHKLTIKAPKEYLDSLDSVLESFWKR